MLEILVAIGPLFLLLVVSELLWRKRLLRGEPARKSLHIIIGSYVASWPYFLSLNTIQLLSLAMLVGVLLSHKFRIFHAINDVKRHTWGDIFYALGVFIAATFATQPWIFALAVLHMSVADGMAGLVGSQLGSKSRYKVFGYNKSVAGTGSFVLASAVMLGIFALVRPGDIPLLLCLVAPFASAGLENIGMRGTDNVLVPAFIIACLRF
ncbi:hypothetical protein EKI60_03105 [Candidatus Saccharibacteria bacterium]|nr:MAG: hypothetical protein EKI60_03105 [Candidatus Saccharibacteria bacterium]